MFFFGILGFVLIVSNLIRRIILQSKGYDLLFDILILVFYAMFFGWIVKYNIRFWFIKEKMQKMRDRKRGVKLEKEAEFIENSDTGQEQNV